MAKRKQKRKKKPEDYHRFSMRADKKEIEEWKNFGKKHGKTSVAKFIRAAIEAVQRTPSLLEPTENPFLTEVIKARQETNDERDEHLTSIETRLEFLENSVGNIERLLEKIAIKEGLSKREIKEAQRKDVSSEVIFE